MTAEAGAPGRIVVVTASNSSFMPFLEDMLASLQPVLARPDVDLACFDIGLNAAHRDWLTGLGAQIAVPGTHLGADRAQYTPALRSFLARPFLPEYFPGYAVYVWIDSDVWFQGSAVFDAYVAGALDRGMAITHESERAYRFQPRLFAWTSKHFLLGYGLANTAYLLNRPHLNAGLFAIRAGAPHWHEWARRYQAAFRRTQALVPHDQFALNQALHGALPGRRPKLGAALLDPTCNWICDRGVPMWNDDEAVFCKPYPPYQKIGALHLAGPAKRKAYRVRQTGGASFVTRIVRSASPASPVVLAATSDGPASAAA